MYVNRGKWSRKMPNNAQMAAVPAEDVLDVAEIQGNSLAGFKKDHQMFLFAVIEDVPAAKEWLKRMLPQIARLDQVLPHNLEFKRLRRIKGIVPPELKATWINIAFSSPGLTKLSSATDV